MDPLWILSAFILGFAVNRVGLPPLVGYLIAGFVLQALGVEGGEALEKIADLGVMLSASHNPFEDNGIKLFGPDGYKLSDDVEAQIEELVGNGTMPLAKSAHLGRAVRLDHAAGRYIEFVKYTFPRGLRLDGLKVVVDCAHGAAYRVAPQVFYELGADVVAMGVEPNGTTQ